MSLGFSNPREGSFNASNLMHEVLLAGGYTGSDPRVAAGVSAILSMELDLARSMNIGTQISSLVDAVGQAVSGITTNISGGQEVGGRF